MRKCLDSVLAQSFADFEVLLINDGSTDGSGKICDDYAQKDARVKVFHKENGGVSSARNLGLDNATGEWISFVDSDDYVEKNYFEVINNNLSQEIDVLVFSYWKIVDELRNSYSFEAKDLKIDNYWPQFFWKYK